MSKKWNKRFGELKPKQKKNSNKKSIFIIGIASAAAVIVTDRVRNR